MQIDGNAAKAPSASELEGIMRQSERLRAQETGRLFAAFGRWVTALLARRGTAGDTANPASSPRNPSSAIF